MPYFEIMAFLSEKVINRVVFKDLISKRKRKQKKIIGLSISIRVCMEGGGGGG